MHAATYKKIKISQWLADRILIECFVYQSSYNVAINAHSYLIKWTVN